jgi:hypothetical protein
MKYNVTIVLKMIIHGIFFTKALTKGTKYVIIFIGFYVFNTQSGVLK